MIFLSSFVLFLVINSMDATLLDFRSLMPNIFSMVPLNGQIKVNDQVFNIGPNSTARTSIPTIQRPQVNNNLFTQQMPNFDPQVSNIDSRVDNFETRTQNFETRIPNFETRNSNFDSQILDFNRASNPISIPTQPFGNMNRMTNAASGPSAPTTPMDLMRFGLPQASNGPTVSRPAVRPPTTRSELNPSEMALIQSPVEFPEEPQLNTRSVVTTPIPPNFEFNSFPVSTSEPMNRFNVNQRQESSRFQPLPSVVSGPINDRRELIPPNFNGDSSHSIQVTRETSFVFPPATVNQIPTEHVIPEPEMRSQLEQHLPPVMQTPQQNFNTTTRFVPQIQNSSIPIEFMSSLFRPQGIPTLAELDALRAQSTPSLAPMK